MAETEHPRIWLEPAGASDRCWCSDNQWGDEGVEYVLASAPPNPPHQEEGAAGLAERLSDWRARGVSGEDADAAASALLSQASQIEALRKERDEARLCQQQIAAGSNQSATVARIIIAKNEADGRAEAAETKLAEALALLHKVFDGGTSLERSSPLWIRARNFLDANGDGHAQ